jgi:hypothetical protein
MVLSINMQQRWTTPSISISRETNESLSYFKLPLKEPLQTKPFKWMKVYYVRWWYHYLPIILHMLIKHIKDCHPFNG